MALKLGREIVAADESAILYVHELRSKCTHCIHCMHYAHILFMCQLNQACEKTFCEKILYVNFYLCDIPL